MHKMLKIFSIILLMVLITTGCGSSGGDNPESNSSISDANQTISIGGNYEIGDDIVLTLSKDIENISKAQDKITISKSSDGTSPITFTIKKYGTKITITPNSDLEYDTKYYVIIQKGAVGNTKGQELDFTTPKKGSSLVSDKQTFSSVPADEATDVAVGGNIVLTFAKAIKTDNSKTKIFLSTSQDKTGEVGSSISMSGKKVIINPNADLSHEVKYYVIIEKNAVDDVEAKTLSFTTIKKTPVSYGQTFEVSDPVGGATGVATDKNIVLTFAKSIDKDNSKTKIFLSTNQDKTGKVNSSISMSGKKVIINPNAVLSYETKYYVIIEKNAVDDVEAKTLSFTTAGTEQTFSSIKDKDNREVSANIILVFTKNISNVDKSKIELKKSGGSSVTFVSTKNGKEITIDPNANLEYEARYDVTVKAGAVDDNEEKTLSFTTKPYGQTFIKSPQANKIVDKDDNIVLVFSKDVKNVIDGDIVLSLNGVTKNKIITKNGKEITIDPTSSLEEDKTYSIVIKANSVDDLKDKAEFSFKTKPALDTEPPKFSNASALNDRNLTITFDEKLDDKDINNIIISSKNNQTSGALTIEESAISSDEFSLNIKVDKNIEYGWKYYIFIKEGAVADKKGNINKETNETFTRKAPDPKWIKYKDIEIKVFYDEVSESDVEAKCKVGGGDLLIDGALSYSGSIENVFKTVVPDLGLDVTKYYWLRYSYYGNIKKSKLFFIKKLKWEANDSNKSDSPYLCQRYPTIANSDWTKIDGSYNYQFKVYGEPVLDTNPCPSGEELITVKDLKAGSYNISSTMIDGLDLNGSHRYWVDDNGAKKQLKKKYSWEVKDKSFNFAYPICKKARKVDVLTELSLDKNISSKQDLVLEFTKNITKIDEITLKNTTNGSSKILVASTDYTIANKSLTIKASNLEGEKKYQLIIEEDKIDNLSEKVDLEFSTKKIVCPGLFEEYDGENNCYMVVDEEKTWQEAQDACYEMNSSLSPQANMPSSLFSTFKDKDLIFGTNRLLKDNAYWLEEKDTKNGYYVRHNFGWETPNALKTSSSKNYICYKKLNTPPSVTKISPNNNATDVSTRARIRITFSEVVKDFNETNIKIKCAMTSIGIGSEVEINSTTYSKTDKHTLKITPKNDFDTNKRYCTVTLNPASATKKIIDVYGNELPKYSSKFTITNSPKTCVGGVGIEDKCYLWQKTKQKWNDANSSCYANDKAELLSKDNPDLSNIANALNLNPMQSDGYSKIGYWLKDYYGSGYGGPAHYNLKAEGFSSPYENWSSVGNYSSDTTELQSICVKDY